ncbi:hypothetical protein HY493_04285 [Candidatus Woesearchaeota archaeon]|nr:hypothetical protein [Candidatus Woesearchaeota archaeon]
MAKPTAKQQLVKKAWMAILAPKLFGEGFIGETFIAEPETALGRLVTVSMTTLTNDPSQQHINLSFKIAGKTKDALTTELIGYRISPSSTKRFVRRARSKIDDSFSAVTSDGKKLRIKPMIVTRGKAQGGTRAALQKATRQFFILHLSKMTLDQFWQDVLGHTVQKALSDSLRKLYPLATCELRWIAFEGEGVPPEAPKEEPKVIEEPKEAEAAQ